MVKRNLVFVYLNCTVMKSCHDDSAFLHLEREILGSPVQLWTIKNRSVRLGGNPLEDDLLLQVAYYHLSFYEDTMKMSWIVLLSTNFHGFQSGHQIWSKESLAIGRPVETKKQACQ